MENDLNLNQHISKKFNEELESLRDDVMQMGGMVEEQLSNGIIALTNVDYELGKTVIKGDKKINQTELAINEQCIQVLARRQPTASDLRLVISILKCISDLERIGDLAQHLGKIAVEISEDESFGLHHFSELNLEIENLGERTKTILSSSLNAFARLDHQAALDTMEQDNNINREHDALSRQLITYMMEDPRTIKSALRISLAARSFERIGDHSKNICENVVYLVKGEDIRYISLDKVRHKLADD